MKSLIILPLFLASQVMAGIFVAPVCKSVLEEKCWDEPTTDCKTVQVPVTRTETRRQCSTTFEKVNIYCHSIAHVL
jgi:hypothetical protein